MRALAAVTLADEFVVLEPLGPRHRDGLAEAVAEWPDVRASLTARLSGTPVW